MSIVKLSDREKAAFILGMVKAFKVGKWPKHFNKDDRGMWESRGKVAEQILDGGAFNPLHVWNVLDLANEELGEAYATD